MMTGWRALTIRQPWAWAVIHAGKNPENRSRGAAGWTYRGPLIIHAAVADATIVDPDASIPSLRALRGSLATIEPGSASMAALEVRGAAVGVVDLEDIHLSARCCAPWGESSYRATDRRLVVHVAHLWFEHARALFEPVPMVGRLGLWRPQPDDLAAVEAQL